MYINHLRVRVKNPLGVVSNEFSAVYEKEGRPVESADKPFYLELFQNPIAMNLYRGGPVDIGARFDKWVERGGIHSYSALVLIDRVSEERIGHVVLGHGDYKKGLLSGSSEIAVVVAPPLLE